MAKEMTEYEKMITQMGREQNELVDENGDGVIDSKDMVVREQKRVVHGFESGIKEKMFIAFICAILLVIIVAAVQMGLNSEIRNSDKRIARVIDAGEVTAEFVSSTKSTNKQQRRLAHWYQHVVFSYSAGDDDSIVVEDDITLRQESVSENDLNNIKVDPKYEVGDEVEIYVNKDDPHKFIMGTDNRNDVLIPAVLIITFALFATWGSIVTTDRNKVKGYNRL